MNKKIEENLRIRDQYDNELFNLQCQYDYLMNEIQEKGEENSILRGIEKRHTTMLEGQKKILSLNNTFLNKYSVLQQTYHKLLDKYEDQDIRYQNTII